MPGAIVLVCLGCYDKNPLNGVASKQQTFISHSLKAGKFEIMTTAEQIWYLLRADDSYVIGQN